MLGCVVTAGSSFALASNAAHASANLPAFISLRPSSNRLWACTVAGWATPRSGAATIARPRLQNTSRRGCMAGIMHYLAGSAFGGDVIVVGPGSRRSRLGRGLGGPGRRGAPARTAHQLGDLAAELPRADVVGRAGLAVGPRRDRADDLVRRLIRAGDRDRLAPRIAHRIAE